MDDVHVTAIPREKQRKLVGDPFRVHRKDSRMTNDRDSNKANWPQVVRAAASYSLAMLRMSCQVFSSFQISDNIYEFITFLMKGKLEGK